MKLLYSLIFGLLVSLNFHAQNCKELDRKQFFTSLKFGDKIPTALLDCLKKKAIDYPGAGILRIQFDSLNPECQKKYADLFKFQGLSFKFSQLMTHPTGQVTHVEMYSFFKDDRSGDSIVYAPPANFIRLSGKLRSLYGDPITVQSPTKTDSLFIKEKGIEQVIAWGCNNYDLTLSIRYGARNEMLNVFAIQIRNRNFDVPVELESHSQ